MNQKDEIQAREPSSEENPSKMHAGHRMRLRRRVLAHGLDGMEAHEAVELLLFESLPRRNTNGIAHRLLFMFVNLTALFRAKEESLRRVRGIGMRSASLIASVLPSAREAVMKSLKEADPLTRWNLLTAGDFCLNFAGEAAAVVTLSADGRFERWRGVKDAPSLFARYEEARDAARVLILLRGDISSELFPIAADGQEADPYESFPKAERFYVFHPEHRMEEILRKQESAR